MPAIAQRRINAINQNHLSTDQVIAARQTARIDRFDRSDSRNVYSRKLDPCGKVKREVNARSPQRNRSRNQ